MGKRCQNYVANNGQQDVTSVIFSCKRFYLFASCFQTQIIKQRTNLKYYLTLSYLDGCFLEYLFVKAAVTKSQRLDVVKNRKFPPTPTLLTVLEPDVRGKSVCRNDFFQELSCQLQTVSFHSLAHVCLCSNFSTKNSKSTRWIRLEYIIKPSFLLNHHCKGFLSKFEGANTVEFKISTYEFGGYTNYTIISRNIVSFSLTWRYQAQFQSTKGYNASVLLRFEVWLIMFHTFSLLELIFLKVRHKSLFEPQLLLIWWEFISHFSYCSD